MFCIFILIVCKKSWTNCFICRKSKRENLQIDIVELFDIFLSDIFLHRPSKQKYKSFELHDSVSIKILISVYIAFQNRRDIPCAKLEIYVRYLEIWYLRRKYENI